jgi:ABC-type phosphate transport system substrate-binding protein
MNLKHYSPQLIALLVYLSIIKQSVAIEIIVNESVDLSTVSYQQIKSIYLGQQSHWPNGNLIKLYKLPSKHKTHQSFVKNTLGLYPYQFNRRWQKLFFSGFASKPTEVSTEKDIAKAVANTPGAIGYIENKIIMKGVRYVAFFNE